MTCVQESRLKKSHLHMFMCIVAGPTSICCSGLVLAAVVSMDAFQTVMGQLQVPDTANFAVLVRQQMEAVQQIVGGVRRRKHMKNT